MDNAINFVAKQAVKAMSFSKGSTVQLGGSTGHDLEIVNLYLVSVTDATVATRTITLSLFSGSGGTGTEYLRLFSLSQLGSLTKRIAGGQTQPASFPGVDDSIMWNELVIPGGAYLYAAEANYVAGDTWTMRVLYRDTPTNLML